MGFLKVRGKVNFTCFEGWVNSIVITREPIIMGLPGEQMEMNVRYTLSSSFAILTIS